MEKANAGRAGFTLVEMLVVLGIAALLMTVAVPGFARLMTAQRMSSFTTAFVLSLHQARSEAIKRNTRVVLCKSANALACTNSGGWEQGWIMFADLNNNAVRDTDESIVQQHGPAAEGVRMRGNAAVRYVAYTADGYARGSNQTFTVCSSQATETEARQIILSPTGRPRTQRVAAAGFC